MLNMNKAVMYTIFGLLTIALYIKSTMCIAPAEFFDRVFNRYNEKRNNVFQLTGMEWDTSEESVKEVTGVIEKAERDPNWIPEAEDDHEFLVFRVPKGLSPLIGTQSRPCEKMEVTRRGPSQALLDLFKHFFGSYHRDPEIVNAELIKKIQDNAARRKEKNGVEEPIAVKTLGDYYYGQKLGRGQASDVFTGIHKETGSLVIIKNEKETKESSQLKKDEVAKALNTAIKQGKEYVPAVPVPRKPSDIPLYQEFNLYGILGSHDGFGAAYHFGIVDNYGVMVGEMLGENVEAMFNRRAGKWTKKSIIFFILDALKLLEYFHAKNWLHRDVKQGNFLLPRKGSWKKGLFHLIDYDNAKEFRVNGSRVKITGDGVGTPPYMSVDVIDVESNTSQTEKVDVEPLGYMGIEFHRGSFPWNKQSMGVFQKVELMKNELKRQKLLEEACFEFPELSQFIKLALSGEPKKGDKYDYGLLKTGFHALFDEGIYEYDYEFDWYQDALSHPSSLHITMAYKNILGDQNESRDIAVVKVAKFYSRILREMNRDQPENKFKVEENLMLDATMLLSSVYEPFKRHNNLDNTYVAFIVYFGVANSNLSPNVSGDDLNSETAASEKSDKSDSSESDTIYGSPLSPNNIYHPQSDGSMPIFQSMMVALGLGANGTKGKLSDDISNQNLTSVGFAWLRDTNANTNFTTLRLAVVLSNDVVLTQIKMMRQGMSDLIKDKKVMKLASEYLQQRLAPKIPVIYELHDMSTYEIVIIPVKKKDEIDNSTLCVLEALKMTQLCDKIRSPLFSRFGFASSYNEHTEMTEVVFILRQYIWRACQYLDGRRDTTQLILTPETLFMQHTHYMHEEDVKQSPETETYNMVRNMVKCKNESILDPNYHFVHFTLIGDKTQIHLEKYDLGKFVQELNDIRGETLPKINLQPPREMVKLAYEVASRSARSDKVLIPSGYQYELTQIPIVQNEEELLQILCSKIKGISWLSDPDVVEVAVGSARTEASIIVAFIMKLFNHDSLVLLDERRRHRNAPPLRIHSRHTQIKSKQFKHIKFLPTCVVEWSIDGTNIRSAGDAFHALMTDALNAGMPGFLANTKWRDQLLDQNMKQLSFVTVKPSDSDNNWKFDVFLYEKDGPEATATPYTAPPMLTPTFINPGQTNFANVSKAGIAPSFEKLHRPTRQSSSKLRLQRSSTLSQSASDPSVIAAT